jgi:hypothetical protein
VAFAIVMPVAFVGSVLLLAARRHIEADTAKIFEAIQVALAEQRQQTGTTEIT